MMATIFRRLVMALSVLAFVSGMTVQAMPSAEALGLTGVAEVTKADMDRARMAAERAHSGAPKPMPCKSNLLDCVKQMGCIGSPNLPSRCDDLPTPVSYTGVAYWSPSQALPGLSIRPDLFPPIAA
jgi:hypothetical protein